MNLTAKAKLILQNISVYPDGLTREFLENETKLTKAHVLDALTELQDKGLIKRVPQYNSSFKYKVK